MGEDITREDLADRSGWVTTRVAAQALRIDPRTVRKYIKQGKLEARVEGEGVEKTYLVSIDSIYALRGREPERTGPRMVRENVPREAAGSAVSEDLVALVRDLTTEVSRRSSEAAELRTRLELTERAESSQREALEQRLETERVRREQAEQDRDKLAEEQAAERLRREEAEREREELRQRLEAAVEAREPLQTPSEGPDRGDVPPGSEHPVERPSWWRKFFGFE